MAVSHGRLVSATEAPAAGEMTEEIARFAGIVIEQILSGALAGPIDYEQAHDEWVLVLGGSAVLAVGEDCLELTEGDWVFLPAHVSHRLVETRPGTSWLTVHNRR